MTTTGAFRLLISDMPVAIDEFDELTVSFERARIFRGEGSEEKAEQKSETETAPETVTETATATATQTQTTTETATSSANETATATTTEIVTESKAETEDAETEEADEDERGFYVIDLGGASVDLTQVVGEKAIGVFDGELEAGWYTKIELYASSVEGIVEGEEVGVKIPSGKLQIVKPFEVVAGETLSFVFDINVVKKGNTDYYNLLPVISESGVAGEEVEVEEIGSEVSESDGTETADSEAESTATDGPNGDQPGEGNGGGQDPPNDAGKDS